MATSEISKIKLLDGTTADVKDATARSSISGFVTGPSSAADGKVAVFDGTTGKIIKDSGVTLGAAASKAVTNNTTADTAITKSANLPTCNSIRNCITTKHDVATAGLALDATVGKTLWDDMARFNSGRSIAQTENLNDIRASGIYWIGNACANAPEGFGFLLVFHTGNDYVMQLMFRPTKIYLRREDSSWTSWKSVSLS